MRSIVALALCPLLLTACGERPGANQASSQPVAFHTGAPRDAETLYRDYCLRCHAADNDGGMAGSLIDDTWQYANTDRERYNATADGLEDAGMPAFGAVLSKEEINSILALIDEPDRIREMSPEAPPEDRPTRVVSRHYVLDVQPWVAGDIKIPWAIAFLDERTALVTERPGGLRMVVDGWLHPDPIAGTPEVLHSGQGGLMDVAIDPDYAENGWVYLSYSHAMNPNSRRTLAHTRVVRGRIKDHAWVDEEVIFQGEAGDYSRTRHHYGSRIIFDNEGMLYHCIGDRGERTPAQDLGSAKGKVHRHNPDGSIPSDNPFVGESDALDSVYSYGHRNPQGMAFHPETGALWLVEHGPRGGDEVNIVEPGKDYGWPTITYGINYSGTIITRRTEAPDMEQPILYWEPSIAVCGSDFVVGDEFPRWKNDYIVTGLVTEEVRRLVNTDGRVIHDELLLEGYGRVRDVGFDSEGVMYVVTNSPDRVWRVTNKGNSQR